MIHELVSHQQQPNEHLNINPQSMMIAPSPPPNVLNDVPTGCKGILDYNFYNQRYSPVLNVNARSRSGSTSRLIRTLQGMTL